MEKRSGLRRRRQGKKNHQNGFADLALAAKSGQYMGEDPIRTASAPAEKKSAISSATEAPPTASKHKSKPSSAMTCRAARTACTECGWMDRPRTPACAEDGPKAGFSSGVSTGREMPLTIVTPLAAELTSRKKSANSFCWAKYPIFRRRGRFPMLDRTACATSLLKVASR